MKIKEFKSLLDFTDIQYKINLQSLIYKNDLIKERIDVLMRLKDSPDSDTLIVNKSMESIFNKFPEYIKFIGDRTGIDQELKMTNNFFDVVQLELNEFIKNNN